MSKRIIIDTATGRRTEVGATVTDISSFATRLEQSREQQDAITLRAERMAAQSDFTREDFRNAKPRTRLIWQRRAMAAMMDEGHDFSQSVVLAYS